MDELLTIGRLAERTGIPVRTLRFWSDEGAVPPATRSPTGYRLYDATSIARVELVSTMRDLGLGLDGIARVLDGRTTVAAIAEAHVAAIDAQIRALKTRRAVLSTVARRNAGTEETALMNRLAHLSAAERSRIVDDFKAELTGALDLTPELRDRLHDIRIDLPDDPTPDQVDAWIELAGMVSDPGFRTLMIAFLELSTPVPGQPKPPGASIWWARQIVETVAEARARGVRPTDRAAAELVTGMFGSSDPTAVQRCLKAGIDARADHYRWLVSRVRGRHAAPDATEDLEWLHSALTDTLKEH